MKPIYCFAPFLFLLLLMAQNLEAQHPTPFSMLNTPMLKTFRVWGGGGGNFSGKQSTPVPSGLLGLDANWNISDKIQDAKRKINTVLFDFKVHPFVNTLLESVDSMDVRRFAFQDHDFRFQFGARFTHLKEKEKNPNDKARIFAQGFLDIIIVPFQIQNSVADNKGFTSLSLNMGGKFGVTTKVFGSPLGITANPQLDFLFLMDGDGSTAIEEATRLDLTELAATGTAAVKTARGYVAAGIKFELPISEFIITFDLRKYFKMGQGAELTGLTDNLLFSVGTVAMGTIFGGKDKKEGKMNNKGKKAK